jgi:hypothetical protein
VDTCFSTTFLDVGQYFVQCYNVFVHYYFKYVSVLVRSYLIWVSVMLSMSRIAQSVYCLARGWTIEVRSPAEAKEFFL